MSASVWTYNVVAGDESFTKSRQRNCDIYTEQSDRGPHRELTGALCFFDSKLIKVGFTWDHLHTRRDANSLFKGPAFSLGNRHSCPHCVNSSIIVTLATKSSVYTLRKHYATGSAYDRKNHRQLTYPFISSFPKSCRWKSPFVEMYNSVNVLFQTLSCHLRKNLKNVKWCKSSLMQHSKK